MNFQVFLECPLLTINRERKLHHHARAAWIKPVREQTRLMVLNAMRKDKLTQMPVVTAHFRPFQPKHTLADTAGHLPIAKAMLDGAVDAGLLHNDTPDIVISQTFYPPEKRQPEGMQMMLVLVVESPVSQPPVG